MEPKKRNSYKTVNLTIDLELLCLIWDTRKNPDQNLDSRIEELVTEGLQHDKNR